MKHRSIFSFLKPGPANILLSFVILCLPILREQYNGGQYVAWYRPIVVMVDYFRNFQQPHLILVMALFILAVYILASIAVAVATALIFWGKRKTFR